jgi:hypothetical protein
MIIEYDVLTGPFRGGVFSCHERAAFMRVYNWQSGQIDRYRLTSLPGRGKVAVYQESQGSFPRSVGLLLGGLEHGRRIDVFCAALFLGHRAMGPPSPTGDREDWIYWYVGDQADGTLLYAGERVLPADLEF